MDSVAGLNGGAHPGASALMVYGRPLLSPFRLTHTDRLFALSFAGRKPYEKLATLVIGVRFPPDDPSRTRNLAFLLAWIDHFYSDLFDVLLLEQDTVSRIGSVEIELKPYVRHEFVYNHRDFNRGWGYNVATRHFVDTPVVAFMDTDVLTGANFVQEVVACHHAYMATSPYSNIYFTTQHEAALVSKCMSLAHLRDAARVHKPTTIAGGVMIMRRDAFLDVAGFEQYVAYGGEDRALDVVLLSRFAPHEVRMAPFVYAHMHHPAAKVERGDLESILAHLQQTYGCTVDRSLSGGDDIHLNCAHTPPDRHEAAIARRAEAFGDPNLYRSGRALAVNGVYADESQPAAQASEQVSADIAQLQRETDALIAQMAALRARLGESSG